MELANCVIQAHFQENKVIPLDPWHKI